MFGSCKQGFTLLEILVAIALIGVVATIVIPNLGSRRPMQERKQFIARLNALGSFARDSAMITRKIHKIVFSFKDRRVSLEVGPDFTPPKNAYISTSFSLPSQLRIRNFVIEGTDEMEQLGGRQTGELWFFVVPEGLAQQVTINMIDRDDLLSSGKARPIGLVLNPFSVHFDEYDAFQ